jgi:hypothetical protein
MTGFRIEPDGVYDDGSLYLGLGLSPATLTKARRSGSLRFCRQGNRVLYRGEWLLAWLESSTEGKQVSEKQRHPDQSDPRFWLGMLWTSHRNGNTGWERKARRVLLEQFGIEVVFKRSQPEGREVQG